MLSPYAQILVSNWKANSGFKDPDYSHRPKLIDADEMNVTYPINEITRNRDSTIVRAMDANTPPLVRQQLLQSIETLPADPDTSKYSDEDKLSMMKSRYCQSRPELAEYGQYLQEIASEVSLPTDSASPVVNDDSSPETSVEPKTE